MKVSGYISRGVMAVMVLTMLTACKRMPLYDLEKTIELELDLDLTLDLKIDVDVKVDIEVETSIKMPEHMKVGFYTEETDNLRHTEYVGPTGGTISTPTGRYHMLAYTFGTEYVQIRGEGDLNTIEAFTSDITATKSAALRGFTRAGQEEPEGLIIYTPDHLLVARETVEIPDLSTESRHIVIETEAHTIVESYAFEVKNVTGVQYVESVEAFVTNQARSSFFGRGTVSQEPATLWFPVGIDRQKGCFFTVFNTFGKLPGESHSYLHILIRDTDGQEYRITEDITDQFTDPDHHIVIDEEVVIPEPASHGGGIDPSVDPWDEENTDVPIG